MRILLLLLTIGFAVCVKAQNGVWTWMKGSNINNSPAVWGTQGVAAPGNTPPALYEPANWTDQQGNFWIFGGADGNTNNIHNALWKFDPLTNNWTWMSGPQTPSAGVYGTQGVPSTANYPGGRGYGAASWADSSGHLWLFGGSGLDINGTGGTLGDLWRYTIATNEWTWMKGANTVNPAGVFGTQGVAAPANTPPPRAENNGTWVGNNDELWMFGGYSDDMWKFDPANGNWTWMSGGNTPSVPAVWGTQQVASPSNTPGTRNVYSRWKDRQGNFWFFGGYFLGSTTYNDMWKYNPQTLQWTWMAGTQTPNALSQFQTTCDYGTEAPRANFEGRTCWTDECGNFWQFGGFDSTAFLDPTLASQNTLWMFNPISVQFNWIGGSLQPGQPSNYGTILVPAATNQPGGFGGGVGFTALNGDFWMFGGFTDAAEMSNSLWRYQRSATCPAPQGGAAITLNPPAGGCAPLPVAFSAPVNPNTAYSWNFGDPQSATDVSSAAQPSYTYEAGGTFTVTLVVNNSSPCLLPVDTATAIITVQNQPQIQLGNDLVLCAGQTTSLNAGSTGNQYNWSTGDTTQAITVNVPGIYIVQVSNGTCVATDSVRIDFAANGSVVETLNVFTPNGDGINDVFAFSTAATDGFELEIFSRWGNSLFRSSNPAQGWDGTFNSSAAEEGVYYWRLRTNDCFGNPEMQAGFVTLMR
ncbi:MAG: gliding motility-associated C-terminal domain-containing protein [Bacteroidia bacterium]|jgi:gliding motility-associated-like protein|nr:gliding motility-associated C-terminal domain-containing protein [Bacteroidia bacterium]